MVNVIFSVLLALTTTLYLFGDFSHAKERTKGPVSLYLGIKEIPVLDTQEGWDELNSILQIAQTKEYEEYTSLIFSEAARKSLISGNYEKGLEFANFSISKLNSLTDISHKITTLKELGIFYLTISDTENSAKIFGLLAEVSIKNGFESEYAFALSKMAQIYSTLGLHDLALPMFEKSFSTYRKLNNYNIANIIALNWLNALIEFPSKNNNEKIDYLFKYAENSIPIHSDNLIGYLLRLQGNLEVNQGNFDAGNDLYNNALYFSKSNKDKRLELMVLYNIAKNSFNSDEISIIEKKVKEFRLFCETTGNLYDINNANYLLSKYFNLVGDYENAFMHLQLYTDYLKSNTYKKTLLALTEMDDVIYSSKLEMSDKNSQRRIEEIESESDWLRNLYAFLMILSLCFITYTYVIYLKAKLKLRFLMKDSLTGAFQRSYFDEFYPKVVERFNRRKSEDILFGITLVDIDDFKRINDTYGHREGDRVIVNVYKTISECLRKTDTVFRWGGDEFLIVSERINIEGLKTSYDRIRNELLKNGTLIKYNGMSISGGYVMQSEDNWLSFNEMFDAADKMLYENKRKQKKNYS